MQICCSLNVVILYFEMVVDRLSFRLCLIKMSQLELYNRICESLFPRQLIAPALVVIWSDASDLFGTFRSKVMSVLK